jgi:hypothetical protein
MRSGLFPAARSGRSSDGETNWIEGVQLLSVYLILGILFFHLPEPQVGSKYPR